MTQTQKHNAELTHAEPMPTIVASDLEYDRLVSLADAAEERVPDVAGVLQSKMERAQVVPADAVPADVVRMGSIVEFRSDAGQQKLVTLVFPGDADFAQGRISILTPIGAALIGLSPGQTIAWTARDSRRHRLTVLRVEQPASSHASKVPVASSALAPVR